MLGFGLLVSGLGSGSFVGLSGLTGSLISGLFVLLSSCVFEFVVVLFVLFGGVGLVKMEDVRFGVPGPFAIMFGLGFGGVVFCSCVLLLLGLVVFCSVVFLGGTGFVF